jgi:hypothetical protein
MWPVSQFWKPRVPPHHPCMVELGNQADLIFQYCGHLEAITTF